jgi:hypothetical protein
MYDKVHDKINQHRHIPPLWPRPSSFDPTEPTPPAAQCAATCISQANARAMSRLSTLRCCGLPTPQYPAHPAPLHPRYPSSFGPAGIAVQCALASISPRACAHSHCGAVARPPRLTPPALPLQLRSRQHHSATCTDQHLPTCLFVP